MVFLNSCQLSGRSTAFQYSVLPSGLLRPHALSKCINAALPPQIERKAHPLLSGRLADFSSVPGYAYQPHRLSVIHLESLRLWEPASREIAWGMRPCLSWDRVGWEPASREIAWRWIPPLARSSRGQLSSLHLFRQGSSVQLRVLQRLLVLKVVDSAVLHPLLHMRPLQLWLESRVPWTAWTSGGLRIAATSKLWRNPDAPDDHDGCIGSRLGSSVRGNASFGTVAGISEPAAFKPPGAGSSLLSSKDFQPQLDQQDVLIRTDNTSVVSYINPQREWRLHPESVA